MRFIVLIIILSPFLWGRVAPIQQPPIAAPIQEQPNMTSTQQPPETYITLNAQKGCSVHVAAWLSPSCTHCAEYFSADISKITAMPGFCLDLHFFPHLYLLDKPVSILIWSQGSDNAYKIAEMFFKNQSKWLDISASREKQKDREEDLQSYIKELENDTPKSAEESEKIRKIKNYLVANDPFLYVKMFALNHFSIDHLEHYLPKGDVDLISTLSMSLVKDLPRSDGTAVNFSPAFTNLDGQLIPDGKLSHGILTPSVAEDMLKAAGQFFPKAEVTKSKKKFATKSKKEIKIDDEIQYADDDLGEDTEAEKYDDPENDMDLEDTNQYIADQTTEHSKKIEKILDKVAEDMANEDSESYQHILSN